LISLDITRKKTLNQGHERKDLRKKNNFELSRFTGKLRIVSCPQYFNAAKS
jgi:hypothetical protein